MDRSRWLEVARIVAVAVLVLAYAQDLVPIGVLWATVAVGLYPLAKTGLFDLIHEHKIGTEMFVTFATIFALIGGEAVAGAVLMTIILLAEFIADLNTERARASIKGLIGTVPRTARLRDSTGERVVDIDTIRAGDVILVRAGEQIPVDGVVVTGTAAVDEAAITGEPTPKDKQHATAAGIVVAEPTAFETLDGLGVAATVDGKSVLVGNQRLLTDNHIAIPTTTRQLPSHGSLSTAPSSARSTSPTRSFPAPATRSPSYARQVSAGSRCSPVTTLPQPNTSQRTRHRRGCHRSPPRTQS